MSDLKRILARTYGGSPTGAYFDIENAADRATVDHGELVHWDCAVSVRVDGVNRFWLQFRGSVPCREAFRQLALTRPNVIALKEVSILLTVEDSDYLRALATAIDDGTPMPPPGRKRWDYVGHRNAAAVRRLADLLQAELPELLRHGVPGPERQQKLL